MANISSKLRVHVEAPLLACYHSSSDDSCNSTSIDVVSCSHGVVVFVKGGVVDVSVTAVFTVVTWLYTVE